MCKRTLVALVSVMFLTTLAFAGTPDVSWGGLWYTYSFFWNNADFDTINEGDQHYYMHGSISCNADFGAGVSTHLKFGAWGTYGRHAITGEGPETGVALREAYLNVAELFDTPLSFKIGKQHVLYGDQVFDGGEDGFMGAKLSYGSDILDMDLFGYRLVEGGGTGYLGSGLPVPDDWDLYGLWATLKLLEGNMNVSPYGFYRTRSGDEENDNPMWVGLRSDGSPVEGFTYAAEFAMMMGNKEIFAIDTTEVDYKGMHYMARLGYRPPGMPLTVGAAYVAFTGNDPETKEDELYESPTWGPYTFGFYKGWPGFGPAHLMRTGYGFSLLAPWECMVTNLNVINGNVGFTSGPLAIRADLFVYSRNKVAEDAESAMGNEIALMGTYNYKETITFGATVGYWIPGKYFGEEDLEPMLGGYIWSVIGF